jgi:hypothetical protein
VVRDLARRLIERLQALSPRAILVFGWLGLIVYAFPGHMSFDSVGQLLESRSGVFSDGHPPAMAAEWRLVELFVQGPVGMLVIQSLAFIAGAYLLFERRMSKRAAAIAASLLLWFPPVANTMSTIWKDSQMTGFLVLGTGLLLSSRRRTQLLALLCLVLATAMRHNAFAMTFPLVGLLFVWNPAHRWYKRYAIAIGAWLAVTLSAQILTRALTDEPRHLWHQSMALCDIVGTLRNVPDIPDEQLRTLFDGIELKYEDHLHDQIRYINDPTWNPVDNLWWATDRLFVRPRTAQERDAVVRAWSAVVPSHVTAYLEYRWLVFRQLLQLVDTPLPSSAYIWFTDIQDLYGSAKAISHNAHPSGIQAWMHEVMFGLGGTLLFRVYFYLFLAFALLPFCYRDREAFAFVASGLTSEAALFFATPTPDFRYSFWLLLATVIALVLIIARRISNRVSNREDHPALVVAARER